MHLRLLLACILTTSASAAQSTCFSDTFSGTSGSPPSPAYWGIDADCDQAFPLVVQSGGELLISSTKLDGSCAHGCSGVSCYTLASAPSFDVSVTFQGYLHPEVQSVGGFGVFGTTSSLPPSATCSGSAPIAVATFRIYDIGQAIEIQPVHSTVTSLAHALAVGDRFRIVGTPGGLLEMYVNGCLVYSDPAWSPGDSDFYASIHSQPVLPETTQTSMWDDFQGSFIPVGGSCCPGPLPGQCAVSDTCTISVSLGGTQNLTLKPNCGPAGPQFYLVCGTLSGAVPGFDAGLIHIPLNIDAYFWLTVNHPNEGHLHNTLGFTGAPGGDAYASIFLPAGLGPQFVGLQLHHAFLTVDSTTSLSWASEAVVLDLVP